MFKNYLTYNQALSFHRSCSELHASPQVRGRLIRSSETMIQHFAKSIYTKDSKEESKCLFVALQNLRDCKETFDQNHVWTDALKTQYEWLHERLEALCGKAADQAESGQLRMFG